MKALQRTCAFPVLLMLIVLEYVASSAQAKEIPLNKKGACIPSLYKLMGY